MGERKGRVEVSTGIQPWVSESTNGGKEGKSTSSENNRVGSGDSGHRETDAQ